MNIPNYVRFYKRANGYYYYEPERNRPRSLRTKNREQARKRLALIYSTAPGTEDHRRGTAPKMTLIQFEEEFFRRHTDIAIKTTDAYELAWKLLRRQVGDSYPLNRLRSRRVDKIEDFKKACLANGTRKTSINCYLRHIRGMLNKAHDWGHITEKIPVRMYRLPKRLPRTLTAPERLLILRYTRRHDYQMYRIIVFGL